MQETREADNVPQDVHEVSAAAPEAASARDPEGESVRLRPGGASAQLRTRRYERGPQICLGDFISRLGTADLLIQTRK